MTSKTQTAFTRKGAPAYAGALLLCAGLLAGCSALPWSDDRTRVSGAAREAGFRSAVINGGAYDLQTWLYLAPGASGVRGASGGESGAGDVLAVYIEGDGAPWIHRTTPPEDPTPRRAVAFDMALANAALGASGANAGAAPLANVLYVARPCQFVKGPRRRGCSVSVWTGGRFSKAVIDAVDAAVSVAVRRHGFKQLDLIGYSGGGAVAMLTAARRTDVRRVVTAAGVLDHQVWTRRHRVSPLSGSLNPADAAARLAGVRQIHITGGDDDVVPPGLFKSLLARMRARGPVEARNLTGVDHTCCWADEWPRIARRLRLGLKLAP